MVFIIHISIVSYIHFYMYFHYMLLTELHNQQCYLNFDSVKLSLSLRKCLDFWFVFGFQIFFFFAKV